MSYPKEVSSLSDSQLIQNIKRKKCSDSLIELASRHQGLFNKIQSRFLVSLDPCSYEQISLEVYEILYRAAKTYQPSLGAFTTWYGHCTKNHILNFLNQLTKHNKFFTELGTWADNIPLEEEKSPPIFAKTVISKIKNPQARKIMNLKFISNFSYRKIGLKLGISPQTVLNIYNKNKEELKFILQKEQKTL